MTEVATRPSPSGPRESDWAAAVAAVRALAPGGKVLLICHVNPDGDALGSMLGFGLRRRLGFRRCFRLRRRLGLRPY